MLGDTAVAVHPEDERYTDADRASSLLLPLAGREIPIVADDAVDPAFGTGAVKVTPAHDPNDFEIGKRHHLHSIDVMTPEARMAETVPERFQGLDRFEARKRVVADARGSWACWRRSRTTRHAVGPLLPLRHGRRAAALATSGS